ncbi:MAG: hypothetical protein QOJ40_943 [Verrucomicrobiota bacterium]
MVHPSLHKITKSLGEVLRELKRFGLWDKGIRCRYAEFLVAEKLAKMGLKIQLLNSRYKVSADIYLPDIGKRVEVKSCRILADGWADASFSGGNQILTKKFDYCVWVVFDDFGGVKHKFVFSAGELKEVADGRKNVGRHTSNQCLLLLAPNSKEYEKYIREDGIKAFEIERELLKNPKRYRDAWAKITQRGS